jgi:hypothetical protein
MFVESLPLCIDIDNQLSAHDFIKQVQHELTAALRHRVYPIGHLYRDLKKRPSVVFGFQGPNIIEKIHLDGKPAQSFQLHQEETLSDSCLVYATGDGGYEVRGILITLQPTADNYKGSTSRELAISFAPDGLITGVNMTMENNSYQDIINNGMDVTDTRRRLEILKFVEDFRSYYDEKDLEALRNIYSEDALIITGKVVQRRNLGSDQARMKPEIEYSKLNKEQYMSRLATTFRNNKFIKVKFDDITVRRHRAKEGFYAVTLRQDWQSSNYSDNGYVFLLWEFKEGSSPVVHVRTWQPEMVGNRKLDPDEVFTENDFFIP